MLYLWSHTWRQSVLKLMLMLMVLVNQLPIQAEGKTTEGLWAWWVAEQQRGGYGYFTDEVKSYRVLQGLGAIFAQIATPARPPQPRGKSPG